MRNQEPGTRNQNDGDGGDSRRRGFRNLRAWELADELASTVFDVALKLPSQHRWLASQMSRAAVSVPANVAEGYGRGSIGDYLRFLDIARGSLSELEYFLHFIRKKQLIASRELDELDAIRDETSRVLFGLWQSLKSRLPADWDHSGATGGRISEERAVYEVDEC
jgi:four helix bundle protein